MSKAKRPEAEESLRERCRKLFKLTPIEAVVAWRQVTEKESQTASYVAALAERGRKTKSPDVQASRLLGKARVQEAMAWLRQELGIVAAEAEEEFSAAAERARSIRFLRMVRDGGFSKILGSGLGIDEETWLAFPPEVQDLFSELEVGTMTDGEGKQHKVITSFKILDRLKAQAMLIDLFGLKKMDPAILELVERLGRAAVAKRAKG